MTWVPLTVIPALALTTPLAAITPQITDPLPWFTVPELVIAPHVTLPEPAFGELQVITLAEILPVIVIAGPIHEPPELMTRFPPTYRPPPVCGVAEPIVTVLTKAPVPRPPSRFTWVVPPELPRRS
jgi:hypothetical protein